MNLKKNQNLTIEDQVYVTDLQNGTFHSSNLLQRGLSYVLLQTHSIKLSECTETIRVSLCISRCPLINAIYLSMSGIISSLFGLHDSKESNFIVGQNKAYEYETCVLPTSHGPYSSLQFLYSIFFLKLLLLIP